MRTKSSEEVWKVLYTQLFCRFGLPLELRSDRGREFSGVVQTKCEQYGIKLIKISVQNPRANGQAERYVQVVKRSIRTVLSELDLQQCDWVECLAACLVGLRFFQHSVLGIAPFTACSGFAPRLPIASLASTNIDEFVYDEGQ